MNSEKYSPNSPNCQCVQPIMPPVMFSKHNRKILIFTLSFCGFFGIVLALLFFRYASYNEDKELTTQTIVALFTFLVGTTVLPFIGSIVGLWLGQKIFGPIRKVQIEDCRNGSPSK